MLIKSPVIELEQMNYFLNIFSKEPVRTFSKLSRRLSHLFHLSYHKRKKTKCRPCQFIAGSIHFDCQQVECLIIAIRKGELNLLTNRW